MSEQRPRDGCPRRIVRLLPSKYQPRTNRFHPRLAETVENRARSCHALVRVEQKAIRGKNVDQIFERTMAHQ